MQSLRGTLKLSATDKSRGELNVRVFMSVAKADERSKLRDRNPATQLQRAAMQDQVAVLEKRVIGRFLALYKTRMEQFPEYRDAKVPRVLSSYRALSFNSIPDRIAEMAARIGVSVNDATFDMPDEEISALPEPPPPTNTKRKRGARY